MNFDFGVVILFVSLSILFSVLNRERFLNPAFVIFLFWIPALVLSTASIRVDVDVYQYLNFTPSEGTFVLISLALCCVSFGALIASRLPIPATPLDFVTISDSRKLVVPSTYVLGLFVFLYSYWNSGLLLALCGSPAEIAFSRQQLHVRHFSLLIIFMDISAIIITSRMLITKKMWLIVPVVLPIFLYLITLQKSRVIFLLLCMIFVAIILHRETRSFVFSSFSRVVVLALTGIFLFSALYATNVVRGVGVLDPDSPSAVCKSRSAQTAPMPSADPTSIFSGDAGGVGHVFVYIGAAAIRNFSSTVQGLVPADQPTYGRLAVRTLLWPFVDRDTLNPTRHLGGINNGTALIYYWSDFRVPGIVAFSLIVGAMAQLAFRLARRRTLIGLLLGAIAFSACAMSIFTDMFFEPLTAIQVAVSLVISTLLAWLPRKGILSRQGDGE